MLANPIKGEVRFDACDASWVLAYPVNTLVALEAEMGRNVWEIGVLLADPKVSASDLRIVFWCGLQARQPETPIEDAGELMDALGLEGAATLIGPAYMGAFPKPEGKDKPNPRKSAGGTGSRSTARGANSGSTRAASGASPPA